MDWGKEWTRQRQPFFYNHLASFFGLSNPVSLTVTNGEGRSLAINGITLQSDRFNGKYFPGRQLTVSSVSDSDGLYVNGWEVTSTAAGQTTTASYATETLSIPMPEGSHVVISPILGTKPLAVGQLEADIDPSLPCEVYDTAGRRLGIIPSSSSLTLDSSPLTLSKGIYILRQGTAIKKISIK